MYLHIFPILVVYISSEVQLSQGHKMFSPNFSLWNISEYVYSLTWLSRIVKSAEYWLLFFEINSVNVKCYEVIWSSSNSTLLWLKQNRIIHMLKVVFIKNSMETFWISTDRSWFRIIKGSNVKLSPRLFINEWMELGKFSAWKTGIYSEELYIISFRGFFFVENRISFKIYE